MSKIKDHDQELENQLKRALADYANLKKRFEKEKVAMVKFANEVLLLQLLGVLDGLEMTARQFQSILKQKGFEKKEVKIGEKFDPNWMEPIESSGEGETVEEVYAPGYKLHEKIVRPAKVRLGGVKKKKENTQ